MIRDERPDLQKERLMRLKHSNSKFFKYCKLNLAFPSHAGIVRTSN